MVLGLIVIRPHERFERGVERYERLQVWRSLVVNVLVNVLVNVHVYDEG